MMAPDKAHKWQWRNRGSIVWRDLPEKPDKWWLQMEYRALDASGAQLWRSPRLNGYNEAP